MTNVDIYVHMYVYIYIYTYTYIERDRQRETGGEREREGEHASDVDMSRKVPNSDMNKEEHCKTTIGCYRKKARQASHGRRKGII